MTHDFNLSTWEAEAGGSLNLKSEFYSVLQSKFQGSQSCTEKPYQRETDRERERDRDRDRDREREREISRNEGFFFLNSEAANCHV